MLLLLSLLPGCPSSRVLLLLLTARCLNECIKNLKSQQKICSEHEQEYSLSILLVVLVVGVVVRARAEIKQGEAIVYDLRNYLQGLVTL